MAKDEKRDKKSKKLLPGFVVLPEVYQELDRTEAPVDVICSVREGAKVMDVLKVLEELNIEVKPAERAHTDYYVFASIGSRKQAEKVDAYYRNRANMRHIGHIWLDKKMETCVAESQKTINAPAARQLFAAEGEGISWAVLDTGIDVSHPCFHDNGNCSPDRRKDFTGEGLDEVELHGTHVAGIITGIAPKVRLFDYKVLEKNGGSSSMIIRALHDIRKANFEAGEMVIHGVNLSLGGPVPVPSYGCGWSPECQEANRLMSSGVVVCIAAGNNGYKPLATVPGGQLDIYSTYIDIGITDPGNAEEVITVGSTHKVYPHSYGPSYFSSKGPTGDGRFKPDCLAPGEKIISARAGTGLKDLEMDGTSMATPHVSGAIAVFLSAKHEFKGQAGRVKDILLKSCTDLKRDRYFQGAGMIDLLRMIQSV